MILDNKNSISNLNFSVIARQMLLHQKRDSTKYVSSMMLEFSKIKIQTFMKIFFYYYYDINVFKKHDAQKPSKS